MKKRLQQAALLTPLALMALCWTASAQVITSFDPAAIDAGGPSFVLNITGTGFAPGATVYWNGLGQTTAYIGSSNLSAFIGSNLIATPGTANVSVVNPGNVSSPIATYTINGTVGSNGVSISSMSPSSVAPGSAAFTLQVFGSGFLTGASLLWNGSPLSAVVVGPTQMVANVPAGLVTTAGNATLQVVNLNSTSSNAAIFTIGAGGAAGAPVIIALSPSSVLPGSGAFNLTVFGSGFAPGANILWNSTVLGVTSFISTGQVSVPVPAANVLFGQTVSISVSNPGGLTSAPFVFTVGTGGSGSGVGVSSLVPASAAPGGPGFTLTVNGSGFTLGASTVYWNGVALTTGFLTSSQLSASVPAAFITTGGTANVQVLSNGTFSNTVTFSIGAGGGSGVSITSLSPNSTLPGGAAFTLTVNGTGFVNGATVLWNGSALATGFLSANQLAAQVPAANIASATTANIQVTSGGVVSNGVTFAVSTTGGGGTGSGTLTITSLSPPSVTPGSGTFALTVTGTGFVPGAYIYWNGVQQTTSYLSPTQLATVISDAQVGVTTTSAQVLVVNPGGAISNSVTFSISATGALGVSVSSLSPASIAPGSPAFTLTLNGTGFQSGAYIVWNGTPLVAVFVSSAQLSTTVPAAYVAVAGTASVTVQNPSGSSSVPVFFSISSTGTAGGAAITSMSPTSIGAGSGAFTLTVNGSGFVVAAAVVFNGSALPAAFVNSTQLLVTVPANLLANAVSATVAVVNPGSAASNGLVFTVGAGGTGTTGPATLTTLTPTSTTAGTSGITLCVNGTGFGSNSVMQWSNAAGTVALATQVTSGSQICGTVPASLIAGPGSSRITVLNGTTLSTNLVIFDVNPGIPTISSGGVVPVYSSVPVVQTGSWISIFGSALSDKNYLWNGDFPTSLGGVTVTIDGKPAYLWSVTPTQVNAQVPDTTSLGPVTVVVNTPYGRVNSLVTLAAASPSFSVLTDGKHAAGVILTPNGTGAYGGGTYDLLGPTGAFSFTTRPAKAGETLILFGVGFGPTNPPVPAGRAYTGPGARTVSPVAISIGGVPAQVDFAGITSAGLYQFNLKVPATGSNDQTLRATTNGIDVPLGPVIAIQ